MVCLRGIGMFLKKNILNKILNRTEMDMLLNTEDYNIAVVLVSAFRLD